MSEVKGKKNTKSISVFSICDVVLLYVDRVVSSWASRNFADEELDARLYLLAWNGWRYRKGSENL